MLQNTNNQMAMDLLVTMNEMVESIGELARIAWYDLHIDVIEGHSTFALIGKCNEMGMELFRKIGQIKMADFRGEAVTDEELQEMRSEVQKVKEDLGRAIEIAKQYGIAA